MAEKEQIQEDLDVLAVKEAKELENMLGEADAEEAAAAGFKGKIFNLIKKFLPKEKKKAMIFIAAVTLVLLLMVAGGISYFLLGSEVAEENLDTTEELLPEMEVEDKKESFILKTAVYTLDPFFMPLNMGSQEIERFVNIKINLLLSNRTMQKDLEKNHNVLRQNIYKMLRKKRTKDFTINITKLKRRLKQEVIILANSLLLSGTGTVDDVFFTQFVVK